MNKTDKIGLIGYGYWGKILYKTLLKLGYKNITICDVSGDGDIKNYSELEVSHILIATPPSTHYEICDHFLRRGVNVFCEKPLVTNIEEAYKLYEVASKTGAKLFTDWTFTYNYAVKRLKQEYDAGLLGSINSITMHRYNSNITHIVDGTTCKWDLACHDVSIIQYLVGNKPVQVDWTEYSKRMNGSDSAFGIVTYKNFAATINVSWVYGDKFRECIFDFSEATVIWDDKVQTLTYYPKAESHSHRQEIVDYSAFPSPLENSIDNFLSQNNVDLNKEITLQTIEILED
jgi:predicted dehydrogenase